MLTALCRIVVYARGSSHEFSHAMSDTYAWEGFPRSHGCLRMSKGLRFLVGSDATVPMQCHACSRIVEDPMWESTRTLSNTDARGGCCLHQACDILRADYRGSHGSSVAACTTDHPPQYRLYYAASCTDCRCRIGGRDPHMRVSSRNERHPLCREECCYSVLERDRLYVGARIALFAGRWRNIRCCADKMPCR